MIDDWVLEDVARAYQLEPTNPSRHSDHGANGTFEGTNVTGGIAGCKLEWRATL
jgi:hypothetical protein